MTRILLCGFGPFADVEVNPTQLLMERFRKNPPTVLGLELHTMVLDTEYEGCEWQVQDAIRSFNPHGVISFGVNKNSDRIQLERIAVNMDDSSVPDNSGTLRRGRRINDGGDAGYWSSLPLEKIHDRLTGSGIGVEFSNHAGTYICNHVFYYVHHLIRQYEMDCISGFIHLPPLTDHIRESWGAKRGMDMDTMFAGARLCVEVTVESLGDRD